MIQYAFISVLLMALVTYFPRVIPIVIFRKEIKSTFIKSFLYYIPFTVLASLTFPDIFYSTGNLATALCGTLIALFLAWRGKGLVTVAIGAILTVFLTGLLFVTVQP